MADSTSLFKKVADNLDTMSAFGKVLIHLNSELETACLHMLDDERFQCWPASISKHHSWPGGLIEHTLQVAMAGMSISDQNNRICKQTVIAAAIFHDFGKVWDYTRIQYDLDPALYFWKKSDHYHLIHHVVKSYEKWMEFSMDIPEPMRTNVGHCILAHHGRKEWGSPVEPATQEAWAVHLADMISVQCIEKRKD